MRRVEFLGANGVGKTTMVRFMLRQSSGAFLDQDQGRACVAKAAIETLPFRKAFARRVEFWLGSRGRRRAKQLRDQSVMALLDKEPGEAQEFIDHALTIIAESSLSINDKRAQTAGIFNALYDALFMGSADFPGVVLCDESISLKALMVASLASTDESAIRLFELMPLPDAIVLLSDTRETAILQRLLKREQSKAYSHIHYLRDCEEAVALTQLKQMSRLAKLGCRVLARRGCPVVDIHVCRGNLGGQVKHLKTELQAHFHGQQEATYA